ncbi:cysteine hydrolase [Corallococcus sp. M34]|uniref:cysteine hydrolase family protein n=1 Tax=Citreicoccus inhibens TaxID=2849499 RepID=UPI001C215E4E|nr:cysteine hydrolase family protein [Citreicoccus inhibens]MBU8894073.1 cysteine hydrolase [Citreicoccus inhibens]
MNAPATLTQLAGLSTLPSPLASAALIIIDMQGEYREGALKLPGIDTATKESMAVLALARKHGAPVFHVVHHSPPGAPIFNPDHPHSKELPELAALPGETTIIKTLPDSFAKTDLHARLQATGRKELILIGAMTHNCVAATAHAAFDLGYRVTIVAEACATRDLPDVYGNVVPADVLHRQTLVGLGDCIAVVVPNARAWA